MKHAGGSRTIWVMAVVAAVSLAAGLGLSRLIESPAQAAADAAPPEAGPITVPVESRVIANDVTLRGDAVYDDPAEVRIETGDADGPAVVTGHVPEVGAALDAASIALEVAGRPVVVLPGDLPTYRTLRAGVTGPDVSQLKAALRALGIEGGDPADPTFDATTARGVEALYQKIGYEAPAPSKETKEQVTVATSAHRDAQEQLATAQRALSKAGGGKLASELIALETAVTVATAQLAEARALCDAPAPVSPDGETGAATCSQSAVARAQGELDAAVAARDEARAAPDTSAEKAQVTAAQRAVTETKTALAEAQTAVLTTLPASEVVFLPSLPRRVDEVTVKRGGTISGPVMTVSGASLEVVASAARADAELLTVGTVGSITVEGTEIPVTVAEVAAGVQDAGSSDGDAGAEGEPAGGGSGDAGGQGAGGGRYTVTLTPGALTPEQLTLLQGTNVRVRIPVSSTGGEVLAVPIAALTAGPGGESRVEVLGADDESRLVTVETGLAAGGYVEITGADVELAKGDLVVVGARGAAGAGGPSPTATEASAG
ncbi:hypothetical protein [Cellulomonas sp. NS3]|uniref:hypothetical protein n=1 Tax=Cellulomonas sp. NS3 TaxID=2973977 RepID=UPI0021617538|nr:hypothetical protein [Cellulomonas sp. NS3]